MAGPARVCQRGAAAPEGDRVGCDRSLPPTPQGPTVAASHGSDQRRPAEGRQWRPRENGMAAGDGGAADFSVQAGRETWKRCEGLVRTGERGAGGVGGVVGRPWGPRTEAGPGLASRRGRGGGGEAWGAPLATVARTRTWVGGGFRTCLSQQGHLCRSRLAPRIGTAGGSGEGLLEIEGGPVPDFQRGLEG